MQTPLFDNGFEAPQQLIEPNDGGDVRLYPHIIDQGSADHFLAELTDTIKWEQRAITVYGKRHLQPRLIAWHGDPGIRYRYSGDTLIAEQWTPALLALRALCERECGVRFNSVLLNRYRDGQDAMGWHADNEIELGDKPVIASISLGEMRRFDLRHRKSREKRSARLPHGSLLVMAGETQVYWEHQIARSRKVMDERINLTFRHIAQ